MAAKHKYFWNLIASGTVLLLVVSIVAGAEKTAENGQNLPQIKPPADKIAENKGKIESPFQILQRTRGRQSAETESEAFSLGPVIATARLKSAPMKDLVPLGLLSLYRVETTLARPNEIREIPADAPAEPAFFVIHPGDRDITGLTYRSTRDTRQVKLILDTDGDGLLSDEKVYLGSRHPLIRITMTYVFGTVTTQNIQSGITGGLFNVQCTDGEWLTLQPVICHEGRVVLDGKSYRIAVVDGDFDGKYNRIFAPPTNGSRNPGCDIFAIDLDGNSKYDFKDSIESEVMPLSRFIKINDNYYNIQLDANGGTIEFRRAKMQFGVLDLGGEDVDLWLWSDAVHQQLKGSGRTWRLPAGMYGLTTFELTEKDSTGQQWAFRVGKAAAGQLGSFEIKPGRTTSFQLGPPYKITTSMERIGEKVYLDFFLSGQAGESYQPGAKKNGTMVPEPGFKIIDESGKVVHTGRFEYG